MTSLDDAFGDTDVLMIKQKFDSFQRSRSACSFKESHTIFDPFDPPAMILYEIFCDAQLLVIADYRFDKIQTKKAGEICTILKKKLYHFQ